MRVRARPHAMIERAPVGLFFPRSAAGAVSSCSPATHARGLNHSTLPPFPPPRLLAGETIKAYGEHNGGRRRGYQGGGGGAQDLGEVNLTEVGEMELSHVGEGASFFRGQSHSWKSSLTSPDGKSVGFYEFGREPIEQPP